ncbi:MAG: acyl-CoA thioesterase [Proteobacteria bacterium]|nr:acyl-CoA thioesterase [Pseudomonadota bacterium]
MPKPAGGPPPDARTSTLRYRVPFYDTDGMQVVHHANYVRYLELARVHYLEEHGLPYAVFVREGLHFAVTHCEVSYLRAARFDDRLEVTCWLDRVRGATIGLSYRIERAGECVARARTEHGMVDLDGRPRRIPRVQREALAELASTGTSDGE